MERVELDKKVMDVIESTRVYLCIDCSKCSASCPVGAVGALYSPKGIVQELLINNRLPSLENLWRCLTCGICSKRCPSNVDFPNFIRLLRRHCRTDDFALTQTHSGIINLVTRIMAKKSVKPRRTWWLPEFVNVIDENTAGETDDIYFVGCAPYFDVIFADLHLELLETHIAALNLLKKCGVSAAVLADERCCGHDAIWQGDIETFVNLASINMENIRRSGAKRLFVTCPEGYYTFTNDYPALFGTLGFEVINTVKYLSENLAIESQDSDPLPITYLDSCRMGRFSGIYDEPRRLIERTGEVLTEMPMNRQDAPCCGNSLWVNCDWILKRIQSECINQIELSGAKLLLSPCDKCRIHLTCASMENGKVNPSIRSQNILTFLYRKEVRKSG
ncbi:MAG: (Fe-S)-binding protein [bacterium]